MRLNKGFLLFELICSLVILVTGIQAIYFMQAATWRTICKVSQDQRNFTDGANTIEQKNLHIERDYAIQQVVTNLLVQEETQKISFHIPGMSENQRGLEIILDGSCVVIKDKVTSLILLAG